MVTIEERKQRIHELRQRRISVPATVYGELDTSCPSAAVRAWKWWAYLWPYPNRHTPGVSPLQLESIQAEHDEATKHVLAQNALYAEAQAAKKAKSDATAAADAAKRAAEADALKEKLRERYLLLPGTTAEQFEADYPALLADHRRGEMERQATTDERARETMRATIHNALR